MGCGSRQAASPRGPPTLNAFQEPFRRLALPRGCRGYSRHPVGPGEARRGAPVHWGACRRWLPRCPGAAGVQTLQPGSRSALRQRAPAATGRKQVTHRLRRTETQTGRKIGQIGPSLPSGAGPGAPATRGSPREVAGTVPSGQGLGGPVVVEKGTCSGAGQL